MCPSIFIRALVIHQRLPMRLILLSIKIISSISVVKKYWNFLKGLTFTLLLVQLGTQNFLSSSKDKDDEIKENYLDKISLACWWTSEIWDWSSHWVLEMQLLGLQLSLWASGFLEIIFRWLKTLFLYIYKFIFMFLNIYL